MSYEVTDSTPMPFGKFMGTPMISVPAKYLLALYDLGCDKGRNAAEVKKYITNNLAGLRKEAGLVKR